MKNPISTYLDVIDLVPHLKDDDNIGVHKFVFSPLQLREKILENDSEIRGILRPLYGSNLEMPPYIANPVPNKENSSQGTLLPRTNQVKIELNPSIEDVHVYKIRFTGTTEFEVESELTGTQGQGQISDQFNTDDGFLTIPSQVWKGAFEAQDVFYIKVYHNEKILILLSALLAAIDSLSAVYAEQSPNLSSAAQAYQERYGKIIEKILNQDIKLEGKVGVESVNLDPIQVDYEISELGIDVTNYSDNEWPPVRHD